MEFDYMIVFALVVWLSFCFAMVYLNGGGIVYLGGFYG